MATWAERRREDVWWEREKVNGRKSGKKENRNVKKKIEEEEKETEGRGAGWKGKEVKR